MLCDFQWPDLLGQNHLSFVQKVGDFPKAIIVSGPPGSGKKMAIAKAISYWRDTRDQWLVDWKSACEGSHPDIMVYDACQWTREDCRQAQEKWQYTSNNGYKFIIILHADYLSRLIANALLKFIEEPTQRTTIFLTYQRSHTIPITLRSRCMHWLMKPLNFKIFSAAYHNVVSEEAIDYQILFRLSMGYLGQSWLWFTKCPFWRTLHQAWQRWFHGDCKIFSDDMMQFFLDDPWQFYYFLEAWWYEYMQNIVEGVQKSDVSVTHLWYLRENVTKFWHESYALGLDMRYVISHICQWMRYK